MSPTPLLVLKMSKFQYITTAVRDQLHWLPVKKTTRGVQAGIICVQGPTSDSSTVYLVDILCQSVSTSSTRRRLRSAVHRESRGAAMQNNKIRKYGKRSFPVSAPLTWNSLPTTVRDVSISMNSFSGRLKAELFRRAYETD